MEFSERTEGTWRKIIHVSVPAAEVQPQLDEKYREYQKNIKLEGFRKGKVPRQLVKKMFGHSIENEVYEPYFDQAWKEVLDNEEYDIISRPEIHSVKFDSENGLGFDIVFDVRPVIESLKLDRLSVEKIKYEVTEKDVEYNLAALREQNAMIYSVEGEAKEGHILIADLQALDRTGVPLVGDKHENQEIWLSPDNQELTRQLVGVKEGESRQITITLQRQEEESSDEPRSQKFLVQVKEIKERRLPELDDEFAKDLGDFETISELRARIEENLKARAEVEGASQFRNALTNEFIKSNDFDIPPSMVENYLEYMVSDYKEQSKNNKIDEKALREYYKPAAIRNIKWFLLREKLVESEGLEVSDADIDAYLESLKTEEDGEKQAKAIAQDEKRKKELKEQLLEDKVMDFLASKAEVQELIKPWRPDESEEENS